MKTVSFILRRKPHGLFGHPMCAACTQCALQMSAACHRQSPQVPNLGTPSQCPPTSPPPQHTSSHSRSSSPPSLSTALTMKPKNSSFRHPEHSVEAGSNFLRSSYGYKAIKFRRKIPTASIYHYHHYTGRLTRKSATYFCSFTCQSYKLSFMSSTE